MKGASDQHLPAAGQDGVIFFCNTLGEEKLIAKQKDEIARKPSPVGVKMNNCDRSGPMVTVRSPTSPNRQPRTLLRPICTFLYKERAEKDNKETADGREQGPLCAGRVAESNKGKCVLQCRLGKTEHKQLGEKAPRGGLDGATAQQGEHQHNDPG